MSNTAPLKHVPTEPAPLAPKRDRRRGAAGRAAALRRAPSDSDCSGETASLSADSGDRKPAPLPKSKSRSRRRGSEWEVLEGLKDGQRFEKRPEVFNGYLHKKRKWPLKGWHKRFFVIDGGILVYARSPTDVARGRLHGSVDVGLSVISAKARRRRIDIDADEFIYHLRAKTADVFRTWLNVLKAHRLYRQHLLTFGARESMPKITAPDLPLPPTETSSRTESEISISTSEDSGMSRNPYNSSDLSKIPKKLCKTITLSNISCTEISKVNYLSNSLLILENLNLSNMSNNPDSSKGYMWKCPDNSKSPDMSGRLCPERSKNLNLSNNLSPDILSKPDMSISPTTLDSFTFGTNKISGDWSTKTSDKSKVLPLKLDCFENILALENHSLCSMNCVTKRFEKEFAKYNKEQGTGNQNGICKKNEFPYKNEMPKTDIKIDSLITKPRSRTSTFLYQCSFNNPIKISPMLTKKTSFKTPFKKRRSVFLENNNESTAMYFLTNKKRKHHCPDTCMRRSRKCTNLVKYKNLRSEPTLQKPLSRGMILGRCKKGSKPTLNQSHVETHNLETNKEDKCLQDTMTVSEYDNISEQLMLTVLSNFTGNMSYSREDLKQYISDIVNELYDGKVEKENNVMKLLFKNLLQYWLNNTSIKSLNNIVKKQKSVDKPSNKCFTRDEKLSGLVIDQTTKETQLSKFTKSNEQINETQNSKHSKSKEVEKIKRRLHNNSLASERKIVEDKSAGESFERDERIQELEKLLKNTVYICDTTRSYQSKEKDIEITKKLIENLANLSKKWESNTSSENKTSNSSTEYPQLQETLNHLISETSINADVAKEFLSAYLDVLLTTSNETKESSSPSCDSKVNSKPEEDSMQSIESPKCEIQAEAIERQISRSVTTADTKSDEPKPGEKDTIDPGQLYLKDLLDKITTIFTKPVKIDPSFQSSAKDKPIKRMGSKLEKKNKKDDPVKEFPKKHLIRENHKDKSVVINLSKYDLEGISMLSDPTLKGMMSITINVKEKPPNPGQCNLNNLNLKFTDLKQCSFGSDFERSKLQCDSYSTKNLLKTSIGPMISFRNPYLHFDPHLQDEVTLKPCISNSDATSKAYCNILKESEHFIDFTFKNQHFKEDTSDTKNSDGSEDVQPCYMLPIIKKNTLSAFQSKSKTQSKEPKANKNESKCKCERPELQLFGNSAHQVIDEKFLLLLLENLTLLSKSIPTMHRDINALYTKLKKRHDKVQKKISQTQGLGLLGQIYSEENNLSNGNRNEPETKSIFMRTTAESSMNTLNYTYPKQYNDSGTGENYVTENIEDFVQTDKFEPKYESKNVSTKQKELVDKECQCYNKILGKETTLKSVLNEEINPESLRNDVRKARENRPRPKTAGENRQPKHVNYMRFLRHVPVTYVDKITSEYKAQTVEISISTPDWQDKGFTKECAVSTNIQCINQESNAIKLSDDRTDKKYIPTLTINSQKTKYIPPLSVTNTQKITKAKKIKALVEELKLLSSNVKLTQTQIDEKKLKKDNEKLMSKKKKDFKVYQLFLGKSTTRSSSITDSNVDWVRSDELKTIYKCSSDPSYASGLVSPTSPPIRGPQAGFVSGTPGGRLASWIVESGGPLESVSRELGQAQLSLQQLQRLLDALELQHAHHDTDISLEGASPNVKKDRRKFGLRKKKSNSKCASIDLAPTLQIDISSSHTALSASTAPPSPGGGASSVPNSASSLPIACTAVRPQSLGSTSGLGQTGPASLTSLTPDQQIRDNFTVLAKDLVHSLKGVVATLVCERGRLRAAMEANEATAASPGGMVAALRTNLNTALQQNSELRSRLTRIHDASDLAEVSSVNNSDQVARPFHQSLSFSSSCVSASEFFDAEEHEDDMKTAEILAGDEAGVIELDGDSSSEAGSLASVGSSQGSEASGSSDNSDGALLSAEPSNPQNGVEKRFWSRRTRLPSPRPNPGGPSLWNLLYKNIGKDLSQISMPVTINEPLNMLQRLCEELEYSELLDAAAECQHPVERCALIAAFAVSAYSASAHRAASKPFNPLLHETYECVRDDRRLRFISEQVSHHPPVSACHAESPKWTFWQEARIKTKFWGKSMEFQPAGRVHVRLNSTGDHYSWNKVTTCVHNLFGGQRWVDQYGEMTITCHGTDISCKLNFVKASSWSSSRHEVRGSVSGGGSRLRLQGRWSEALFAGEPPANRCLWRPGAMPPDYELYYGFTRFAMELNEMEPGLRDTLPPTDTRLRPDQRALEEGDVDAAEQYKLQLEQAQRERRRDSIDQDAVWFRKSFEDGQEMWVFGNEYWKAREAGWTGHTLPRIW